MLICGLKLTHDGAIALIGDGQLIASVEMEKIDNNPRYTAIEDTESIRSILELFGYTPGDVDLFAVDGWGGYDQEALAIQPRLEIGEDHNRLTILHEGRTVSLNIARYHERLLTEDIRKPAVFHGLPVGRSVVSYDSYLHATGHIMGAYCSSPFAAAGEPAYVLLWDGGMYPRLYFVDGRSGMVENLGPLFLLIGNIYSIFSQHFGPFKVRGGFAKDSLSVAGKVMAYIALGSVRRELFEVFDSIYEKYGDAPMGFANVFATAFKSRITAGRFPDEDILCSFHEYLGELLVGKLGKKIARSGKRSPNLCMAGGCALNIKWNSLIRSSGIVSDVYIPPFPNDSGSAIGAACSAMAFHTGRRSLEWSVYAGPPIGGAASLPGWRSMPMRVTELARLMVDTQEPVVFLNGRAELGPRALGNRSILASPVSPAMKDVLNDIKYREAYRPVSPICLEGRASEIFDPGCPDPYMLFDHRLRDDWTGRVPAVRHLDGTSRLQTVTGSSNPVVAALLTEFDRITGIPLLCNTSANLNGSGFFPDAISAMRWGRVNYVWSEDVLYEKVDKQPFPSLLNTSTLVHAESINR
jgi:carbamoyltransferase